MKEIVWFLTIPKVIPARLMGIQEGHRSYHRSPFVKRRENDIWETLVKPGKKAKPGTSHYFW